MAHAALAPGPFASHPDGYHAAARGVIANGHLLPRNTCAHALRLLTDPASGLAQRAEGFVCLRTVIDTQIRDEMPGEVIDPRGGWLWSVSNTSGQGVSWNWAEFTGTDMLALLRHDAAPDHSDWPDGLLDDLIDCLRRAVDCSILRHVRVSYTNITAMSVELAALAGELLGVPEYVEAARAHLGEWIAFTERAGGFEEFNSNTYGGVTLPHLAALAEYVKDDDIRAKALRMEQAYFDHVLDFYHSPTRETCMPRARSYHERLPGTPLHTYLCRLIALRRPDAVFDPTWEPKPYHVPVCCHATDEQLDHLLAPLTEPREVRRFVEWTGQDHVGPLDQVPEAGGDGTRRREIVAYQHPQFCIGSVNEIDSWSQRRALGGYVAADDGAAMVSWRPEITVTGCAAGDQKRLWPAQMLFNLCTGQAGPTVLAGVTTMPVIDGWLCGSHWRQKVSGVVEGVTADFGFDIERKTGTGSSGASETSEDGRSDRAARSLLGKLPRQLCCRPVPAFRPPEVGVPWQIERGGCTFTLLLIGGTELTPSVRATETGMRVTLLRREDFTIDWSDPPRPAFAFVAHLAPSHSLPAFGAASFESDGTKLDCSVEVDGQRLRLNYDPPGIGRLTDRACSFSVPGTEERRM